MIEIEATCTTCGHAFTPAPGAFRRGTWRTCLRCRGDPDEQAPGAIEADSKRSQVQITRPKCQAERTEHHDHA